jgi:hypothetical protein
MLGEMGNLVVKVDVKENVEEGPMMANTELLEAWISSGKANSVSGKTNQVTRGVPDVFELPKVIRIRPRLPKSCSGLIVSRVRLG